METTGLETDKSRREFYLNIFFLMICHLHRWVWLMQLCITYIISITALALYDWIMDDWEEGRKQSETCYWRRIHRWSMEYLIISTRKNYQTWNSITTVWKPDLIHMTRKWFTDQVNAEWVFEGYRNLWKEVNKTISPTHQSLDQGCKKITYPYKLNLLYSG